jgi:tetratricopeptide (TPR) repeat protein
MGMTTKALFGLPGRLLPAFILAYGLAPALPAQTPEAPAPMGGFLSGRPLAPTESPDIRQARELITQQQWTDAARLIDQALDRKPRDPQWRFLQGVLFAEVGKTAESITVFERLTEDFPELSEPYNNLAALYVEQNELHKARLLLERALMNRPDYALAHENLGDVYVWLAISAYQNATKGAQPSPGVKLKLDYLQATPAVRQNRVLTPR